MPRPRREPPEGITVPLIAKVLDDGIARSGMSITEAAAKASVNGVKVSKSTLGVWCQGWRRSEGAFIATEPRDDDALANIALVLDLSPRALEQAGYPSAAYIVRGSRQAEGRDNPFKQFSTKEIADELARRLADER